LCARLEFYAHGGCATDLSPSVLERTLLHADNAYFIPAIDIRGRICRTNLPPNTAFRGFGAPQAVAVMENVLQEVAAALRKDAYEVRIKNCYGSGKRRVTPYGQFVEDNSLPRIFRQLAKTSNYKARLADIAQFNASSKAYIRGIAITAVKFGISFATTFLNQANALVNVFSDGTIQVSTGATEMGQGVHTKLRQLVADEFGVCADSVSVMLTSTEKNNNTSPTAASASTDLNGSAAVEACRQIRDRLARLAATMLGKEVRKVSRTVKHICFAGGMVYDERAPQRTIPFHDLVKRARRERVDLGARGFYATPGLHFDWKRGRGQPYSYYTTGAAVSEVALDRFTGELTVVRVDLLMDIGRRINPAIDRGQVIGGFLQGLGWVTTEELRYDGARLISDSISNYKIPAITDVPPDFRLHFLDTDYRTNLRGSRAVGEPPLLLAVSVWAAVKHALSSVYGGEIPQLGLPATPERILLCLGEIEKRRVDANK
jgi:xanthine dehydrogenase large subunit